MNDNTYLHRVIRKYGSSHFSICLIKEVDSQEVLDQAEIDEINKYDRDQLYNLRFTKGKCGGDTLTDNPNLMKIKQKISDSKRGGKNPQAVPVIAHNVRTGETLMFDSVQECSDALGCQTHDAVSRRCGGIIKKLYHDEWEFHYKTCIDQA